MGESSIILLLYGAVFTFLFFGWRYTMQVVEKRKREEERERQEGTRPRNNRVLPNKQGE